MKKYPEVLCANDDTEGNEIVAKSDKMREIIDQLQKLAMLEAPLLLVGATGTGKDLLARLCHLNGPNAKNAFLALNCAALPDNVLETELFGCAPGAYPNAVKGQKGFFEQADGGSVLLDEIAEMSPQMQIKLLRFFNDGTFRRVGEEQEIRVKVRIICATQKNLAECVKKGTFRDDLYYRLNVLGIRLPALKDRRDDIIPLTEFFMDRFSSEQKIARPKMASRLPDFLINYPWPGNVRQLKNGVYRALTRHTNALLYPENFALPEDADVMVNAPVLEEEALKGSFEEITRRFERAVLARLYPHYPSTRKLAKRLGISHTAVANKLREYGLKIR